MENMELTRIKYPDMRMNLIAYIESLSDLEYQRQYWGRQIPKIRTSMMILTRVYIFYMIQLI